MRMFFKYIFFALLTIFMMATAKAENYDIHCPEKIEVKQTLISSPTHWRGFKTEVNYYFNGVSLYSGKPEEQASLKPDINKKSWKWTFSPEDQIYIVCHYDQTNIQLTQALPFHTTQCNVDFYGDQMGSRGPIPKNITCIKGK